MEFYQMIANMKHTYQTIDIQPRVSYITSFCVVRWSQNEYIFIHSFHTIFHDCVASLENQPK